MIVASVTHSNFGQNSEVTKDELERALGIFLSESPTEPDTFSGQRLLFLSLLLQYIEKQLRCLSADNFELWDRGKFFPADSGTHYGHVQLSTLAIWANAFF